MYFINIFIYSAESGVFDKIHNDFFVFGGLICIGKESKDIMSRKYSHAENVVRETVHNKNQEIKASTISNKNKGKLFRSLNECHKFGVIIKEKQILESIYGDKKSKQRYLDFAYKIAVKKALENLIKNKIIVPDDVENIYFLCHNYWHCGAFDECSYSFEEEWALCEDTCQSVESNA